MKKLYLMITIVNRAYGDEFVSFFRSYCRSAVITLPAEGTTARELLDMWGLESTSKSFLACLVGEKVKKQLFKELRRVMHIDAPGSGIAMAITLNSITISGIEQLAPEFNEWSQEIEEESEEKKMQDTKYELIVVIANQDSTDEIMDVARKAGARGGTLVRAKGTAPEEVKKFFGINISEDKDMVFIAAKKEDRQAIMSAIAEANSNPEGKLKAVSFSLPIDSVAGIFHEDAE